MVRCALQERNHEDFLREIEGDAYIWYEDNWQHDQFDHSHQRYQLTFVKEGYQYFHIGQKIYLVPQNHVIWVPIGLKHHTTSDAQTVDLMVVLFKSVPANPFYAAVHVFAAPAVLKEMLLYAAKWNKSLTNDAKQDAFLKALSMSLPDFCDENTGLHIPVPVDRRLIPISNHINENYRYDLDISMLADKAALSPRSLQRIFKRETGITLQKYNQLVRVLKSIALLDTRRYTLSEIAFMVGYKSLSAFTSSYFSVMKTRPKVQK